MDLPKNVSKAKAVFVSISVLMIVVFLALTIETGYSISKRHPEITPQVVAGKYVFHRKNCMDCHTLLGDGAYYAVDLTKIISFRGEGFVRTLLKNPPAVTAQLWSGKYKRLMPDLNLTSKEIDDLIAFFKWTDKVNTNGWPPGSEYYTGEVKSATTSEPKETSGEEAEEIIKKLNCGLCHSLKTKNLNLKGRIGPDLTNESLRNRTEEWLEKQLIEPHSIPDNEVAKGFKGKQKLMPSYKNRLSKDELKVLVSYLKNLKEVK